MVNGSETAYRNFYDAYFQRLFRYLLVVTGGQEETAREVLQATLVRVARHVKVFDDEHVFWSWLTVLARSALSDQGRKRRRYLAFLDRFTRHTEATNAQAHADADGRLSELLEHGLALLPPDELALVERKYLDGESVRQIAAELQTTEKAVESRLVRIRRKLKDSVLDELKNEPAP